MASGLLGTADLTASTNTSVYTVPSATTSSFSVNFTNRNNVPVLVRLGICASASPANAEYIIYDYAIAAGTSLERTGLVAQAAKIVVVYSNTANVSVQVYGYEA